MLLAGPTGHQPKGKLEGVLLAARRYNGSLIRKTKGSLADTLQCNIWRRAQIPHRMTHYLNGGDIQGKLATTTVLLLWAKQSVGPPCRVRQALITPWSIRIWNTSGTKMPIICMDVIQLNALQLSVLLQKAKNESLCDSDFQRSL